MRWSSSTARPHLRPAAGCCCRSAIRFQISDFLIRSVSDFDSHFAGFGSERDRRFALSKIECHVPSRSEAVPFAFPPRAPRLVCVLCALNSGWTYKFQTRFIRAYEGNIIKGSLPIPLSWWWSDVECGNVAGGPLERYIFSRLIALAVNLVARLID